MKMSKKILLFILPLLFAGAIQVSAATTPTLTLTANGSGDNVDISVSGDANTNVLMYYVATNSGLKLQSLGSTNSSGLLSTTLSSSALGVASTSPVYVRTGGVSGPQSNSVAWPYATSSSNLTLSSTGIALPVGQSTIINAYNNGTNLIYLSNNSNPSVANVNISGSQLTILAMTFGQTAITVCTQGSVTSCASAYVTVTNSGSGSLTFSQNSPTIASGQSLPVTISGGTGAYTVLNNSNSTAVSTSITGSTMTVTANGSTGSAAITVCSTDISSCGIINVTIGNISSSAIIFNQTNPTLSVGQSLSVGMSGAVDGTYNISSNSNPSAITANIYGNTLILVAQNIGTSAISVCGVSGGCNVITATVGYTSNGGKLTLSQTSLSLMAGQSVSVIISGGTTPYTLTPSAGSSSIYSTNLNNNILTVSGVGAGSSSLNVCSAGGACTTLSVWVNALTSSAILSLSQNNLSLTTGSSANVYLTGNGGYYISNNSNTSVATPSLNGSTVTIAATGAGNSNITVCQNGGQCNVIYVSVVTVSNSSQTNNNNTTNTTVDNSTSGLSLVKIAKNSAVYALSGNTRRLYSNESTFWSWHQGTWTDNPATVVSQDVFNNYILAKNITARPGSIIKFDNSPSIYAVVGDAKICQIASTTVADALYGTNWYNRLITIQGSFEADYSVDPACKINDSSVYPDGSLIQYQGFSDVWYISGGQKRLVSDAGLKANNFNLNNLIKNVSSLHSYLSGTPISANDSSIFNLK